MKSNKLERISILILAFCMVLFIIYFIQKQKKFLSQIDDFEIKIQTLQMQVYSIGNQINDQSIKIDDLKSELWNIQNP